MKIGIMQPYFMPYIGYWQLINAVDVFVIYDDVNYINKGWINRNRILINNQENRFIIPLLEASQNKKINELDIFEPEQTKKALWKKIEFAYKKSREYEQVCTMVKDIIRHDSVKISEYIENSIRVICQQLSIDTRIVVSSDIEKDIGLRGQDKIIEICKKLGGDFYINPIGGKELYNAEVFEKQGILLKFIKTQEIIYKQGDSQFHADLSFLDMLFWNEKSQIKDYLERYTLIS